MRQGFVGARLLLQLSTVLALGASLPSLASFALHVDAKPDEINMDDEGKRAA